MTDFSMFISSDGQNNSNINCPFCNSSMLAPNSASILKEEKKLPTITQKKEAPSTTSDDVLDWWVVDDMFTFENIGFTHAVGSVKYLSCADCERGPIGYHDTNSKKNFVALIRVKHE